MIGIVSTTLSWGDGVYYVHVSFGLPGEYKCQELGEAVGELFLYNIFLNCERSFL